MAFVFVASSLNAQTRQEQAPGPVAKIRDSYVSALLRLGDHCCRRSLFNDAESLVREADSIGADHERVADRLRAIQMLRVGVMKGPQEKLYGEFLESGDYDLHRQEITKKRQKLDKRTIARLRMATRNGIRTSQTSAAEHALELMYGIDPKCSVVGKASGGQLWSRVVSRERKKANISHMRLGEAISNRELSVSDLNGKVVLWRSFSL